MTSAALPTDHLVRHARVGAKNLWWAIRGRTVRNPPLPADVDALLFVCLGNICRSPFAAAAAARELRGHGVNIACDSVGLRADQSESSPPAARAAAARVGLSLESHRPRIFDRQMVTATTVVVTMETRHLVGMRQAHPDLAERLVLLPLYEKGMLLPYERYNITDPFGRSADVFDRCYGRISRAVAGLVASLDLPSREMS